MSTSNATGNGHVVQGLRRLHARGNIDWQALFPDEDWPEAKTGPVIELPEEEEEWGEARPGRIRRDLKPPDMSWEAAYRAELEAQPLPENPVVKLLRQRREEVCVFAGWVPWATSFSATTTTAARVFGSGSDSTRTARRGGIAHGPHPRPLRGGEMPPP